ncbi:MAG: TauD/TfdA family dioxygenase [Pseudomonadota bacterium]
MKITPTDAVIGARVEDVDLRTAPDAALVEDIETALEEYGVLIFPEQDISPAEQISWSGAFADLEKTARIEARLDGHPEIFVVGNTGKEVVSFAPIDGSDDIEWHADHMHLKVTARASMLYCLECPPSGGDTLFACMYSGLAALASEEQAEAETLTARHSVAGLTKFLREKGAPGAGDQAYEVDESLVVKYPLVRSHPRTGRKALYFGSKVTIGIEGWDQPRAHAYLTDLEARATAPDLRYAHKWSRGDAVLWDNRRVLHAGTPFDMRHRRCMHRTTWREDQPVV